jgi:hypothetical protein
MIHTIRRWSTRVILSTAVVSLAGLPECFAQVSPPPHRCTPRFTGRPRDIDFIANLNWVQVILSKDQETELISETSDPHLVSIMEAAYGLKANVSVDYKDGAMPTSPKKLTCVFLELKPPSPMMPGYILSLTYDTTDRTCYAVIWENGQAVEVNTKDERAQGILETAVRLKQPVLELAYDPKTKTITRVKVNQP